MARVFLAVASGPAGFNKLLVIKELREGLAKDPEFLTMFLDEARLAARLNHPNVVQTYEVGEFDGRHFIAMDYLEGQPLNAVLARVGRDKIPMELHLRIISEVLKGLHYAHELTDFDGTPLQIVHRDVSPQNTFVTYDGQVKLVDFGIAKAAGSSSLTKAGTFKGKIGYVSPEQAVGDPVDARADVFSVGVMLWEALTGQRMSAGSVDAAVVQRRVTGTERRVKQVAPNVPDELSQLVDKAMQLKPDDRFATALELHDAIESFLDTSAPKKSGSRQLAALMTETFAEDRTELRRIIDEQLKRSVETPSSQDLPMIHLKGHPGSDSHNIPITDMGVVPTMSLTKPTADTIRVPSGHRPGPARWLIPLGIGVVAIVVLVAVAKSWSRSEPVASSSTSTTSAGSAPVASVEQKIDLSVEAQPRQAELRLDGALLAGNPHRSQVVRDGKPHRIRASAEGFDAEETQVVFDKDVHVTFGLRAVAAPGTGAKPPKIGGPLPTKTGDGTRPPKPSHTIDEQDPYKK